MQALANAIAGLLASWPGFAGTETIEALLPALQPVAKVQPAEHSERRQQAFQRVVVERETPPRRVELWSLQGEGTVALLEYDDGPPIGDPASVLEALGEPDIVLENQRTAQGAIVTEHVYARRGLTLSIARPYPGSDEHSRKIVHVQLYRPGTVADYWRSIGPGIELRPSPRIPAHQGGAP